MLVLGTTYTDVGATNEFALNARIAANLGAPILLVVSAAGLTPEQVRGAAEMAVDEAHAHHAHILGVIANRVPVDARERFLTALQGVAGDAPGVCRAREPHAARADRPRPDDGRRRPAALR